jgi:hypothetical protein
MSLAGIWAGWLGDSLGASMRGVSIIEPMVIGMNEAQVRTLEQVRQVVAGTQALEFRSADDDEGRYAWIEQVLQRFGYRQLQRAECGMVLVPSVRPPKRSPALIQARIATSVSLPIVHPACVPGKRPRTVPGTRAVTHKFWDGVGRCSTS